jgi:hypothetical protein
MVHAFSTLLGLSAYVDDAFGINISTQVQQATEHTYCNTPRLLPTQRVHQPDRMRQQQMTYFLTVRQPVETQQLAVDLQRLHVCARV